MFKLRMNHLKEDYNKMVDALKAIQTKVERGSCF